MLSSVSRPKRISVSHKYSFVYPAQIYDASSELLFMTQIVVVTDHILCIGVYLSTYLQFNLNWKPFYGDGFELATGLILRHSPGHTPGLSILQVNLKNSGTWVFTSDQYIIKENYESLANQGWFTRDHASWLRSNQMIHSLQKLTNAKLIFGHDREVLFQYKVAPDFHD